MKKIFNAALLLSTIILFSVLFFWLKGTPKIVVTPEHPLVDEPVEIVISNLPANQQAIIEASCKDKDNNTWSSRATFQTDDKGVVNVAKQAPISGSYNGVDPMGLFWSLTQTDKDPFKNTLIAQSTLNLCKVLLSVFSGDKLQAQKIIDRVWPDVESKDVREQSIVGTLCYPKSIKKMPGIITIHGAGGVPDIGLAQLLASHGYTVLALVYFGAEGLPKNLSLIPLEYFQNAMRWLKKQPQVEGNKIAILGQTRGAELVLLLASLFPDEMSAGIAYSPSHLVYGDHSSNEKSAWTYKNKPVPFMPMLSDQEVLEGVKEGHITLHKGTIEDPILYTQFSLYHMKKISNKIKEVATIPVENIRCPILIISGDDDQQQASSVSGKSIMERLDSMGSRIKRKYVNYPNAGNHLLTFPYRSSIDLPFIYASSWTIAGGTPEGNAHAIKQAWAGVLEFLDEVLK
jgi:dienelactone hydrolase